MNIILDSPQPHVPIRPLQDTEMALEKSMLYHEQPQTSQHIAYDAIRQFWMVRIRNLGCDADASVIERCKAIGDGSVAVEGDCLLGDFRKGFGEAEEEFVLGKGSGKVEFMEDEGGEGVRDVKAEGLGEGGDVGRWAVRRM